VSLAQNHRISPEVVGRRLIEAYSGIGIFEGTRQCNRTETPIISILWGASSIEYLKLNRFHHLAESDPLGNFLLMPGVVYKLNTQKEELVPRIGLVGGRVIKGKYSIVVLGLGRREKDVR
jgi:hypothetical protein